MLRWGYNSDTRMCESFSYGGSGGNKNNFMTFEECADLCVWTYCLGFKCSECPHGCKKDEYQCRSHECNGKCLQHSFFLTKE